MRIETVAAAGLDAATKSIDCVLTGVILPGSPTDFRAGTRLNSESPADKCWQSRVNSFKVQIIELGTGTFRVLPFLVLVYTNLCWFWSAWVSTSAQICISDLVYDIL